MVVVAIVEDISDENITREKRLSIFIIQNSVDSPEFY